ncbi:AraC family transcriptional regulator [Dactylosporangium sp. NPDC000555]
MQRVGWHSRSHATRLFRQYVGLTPGDYRQYMQVDGGGHDGRTPISG